MSDLVERLKAKTRINEATGCWEWTAAKHRAGYGMLGFDGRKNIKAHRASYEAHRGPIPNGLHVCHRCDNPPCINPDHLFLGTHADNMADKVAKGRSPRGTKHGSNKLTEVQVLEIRAEKALKWREIAAKYEISMNMVWLIKSGRNWSHLTHPDD